MAAAWDERLVQAARHGQALGAGPGCRRSCHILLQVVQLLQQPAVAKLPGLAALEAALRLVQQAAHLGQGPGGALRPVQQVEHNAVAGISCQHVSCG